MFIDAGVGAGEAKLYRLLMGASINSGIVQVSVAVPQKTKNKASI